jgi:hypothetical protein
MINESELVKKLAAITLRCWQDDAFRQRLQDDPDGVSKEYDLGAWRSPIRFVADTPKVKYVVIPQDPRTYSADKTDASLRAFAEEHIHKLCTVSWDRSHETD